MTKKNQTTKEKIFGMALSYFNEHGIEYTGMREMARDLGISPGNLTYHYPTKEDLLLAISASLTEGNKSLLDQVEQNLTMQSFMEMTRRLYLNQYEHRCLFASFAHGIRVYKRLRQSYAGTEKSRWERMKNDFMELRSKGYLKSSTTDQEIHILVRTFSLISRFWLSEVMVSFRKVPKEQVVEHYLGIIANTFIRYSTPKATTVLTPYLNNILMVE